MGVTEVRPLYDCVSFLLILFLKEREQLRDFRSVINLFISNLKTTENLVFRGFYTRLLFRTHIHALPSLVPLYHTCRKKQIVQEFRRRRRFVRCRGQYRKSAFIVQLYAGVQVYVRYLHRMPMVSDVL